MLSKNYYVCKNYSEVLQIKRRVICGRISIIVYADSKVTLMKATLAFEFEIHCGGIYAGEILYILASFVDHLVGVLVVSLACALE